ncbi:MAG TPA: hypothetical protein VGH58_06985 [Solirubrobacterales bacterium]|jgi:hypothetical protein
MDPRTPKQKRDPAKGELKSGLPGTPEELRRQIRKAMKEHAETLRRLAE